MIIRQHGRVTAFTGLPSLCLQSWRHSSIIALICISIFAESIPSENADKPLRRIDSSQQQPISITDNKDPPIGGNVHPSAYTSMVDALGVMESHFFQVSHGTWPQAIDWTAAVMGTQVSATLSAMTQFHDASSLPPSFSPSPTEARDQENLINRYFTQISSFYFGENAFALRTQAYDDMLWVVLGWLEAIKFIKLHSELHYTSPTPSPHEHSDRYNHSWYAQQFVPQYAHRARLFYDLASHGWDTTLCGGGMVWNPYLAPYKNAITNQLYITASIEMYLHFPGDQNTSPYQTPIDEEKEKALPPAKAHDTRYLDNAITAYNWLNSSGMRNSQGLYIDGFHITGWRGGHPGSNGTEKCDLRDEKVYTYNQGVILSGLKNLYEATGKPQYLKDGHELVRNVIAATGWADRDTDKRWQWAGLGRGGIMEEMCDWSGTCSQNAQTFKGIFFHHFTLFCSPLPSKSGSERQGNEEDDSGAKHLHQQSCNSYSDWIRHNAHAASVTRNEDGIFGEWWGRESSPPPSSSPHPPEFLSPPPPNPGTDYRNTGVPRDEIWRLPEDDVMYKPDEYTGISDLRGRWVDENPSWEKSRIGDVENQDINDRGRGRTVETQSGGLAVLRSLWVLVEAEERVRARLRTEEWTMCTFGHPQGG